MMHNGHPGMFHPGGPQSGFRHMPQAATPAPSPPPSPKPTKKMYQTDQTRPFLFPFSGRQGQLYNRYDARDATMVPSAIDEAERLYVRHMYISLSLWQMWRTRQECMTSESGLRVMPGSEGMLDLPTVPPPVRLTSQLCKSLSDGVDSRLTRRVAQHCRTWPSSKLVSQKPKKP
jgi:hypothetical protein